MTISAAMTRQDCYEVARCKTEIITSQRKLNRLLGAISEKERYAARYKSRLICALYDCEIEALYADVAVLEGYVMANELELAHIEAKRREAETQRLVRLFQLTAPTLDPAAPTPTPQASSTPRAKQPAMFGPGPAPIDTTPIGNSSAADRAWAVENDITVGTKLANETREEGKIESALAVIAPAVSPSSAPSVASPTERAASETEKVVAKPEPQPPFIFAYTFDPPKPDSQRPNSQRADSQSPDSQRPVVVEKKSAGVLKEDSYPESARNAAGVQRAEGAGKAACEDATLLAQRQKEEI